MPVDTSSLSNEELNLLARVIALDQIAPVKQPSDKRTKEIQNILDQPKIDTNSETPALLSCLFYVLTCKCFNK